MPASKEGYTWIGSLKLGDYSYAHFRDIDLWKRYVTSLYFAIVTMATVGTIFFMSYCPLNCYNLCTLTHAQMVKFKASWQ